jgi:hypothetical protein
MKKFDLEKAKAGAPVITRSKKDAKVLLFDRNNARFPIVSIVENKDVWCYTSEGKWYANKDSDKDLFLK